jgi:2,3-diketo-5-methylthio-1-phosphopentane phosphatase
MGGRIAIVTDFDGTISQRDIGHHFFEAFIADYRDWDRLLNEWKRGLLSSRVCLEEEIRSVDAGRDDLDRFINREYLDPYFKDFVDFCTRQKFEIQILSDGLDYYIDKMLFKFGLGFLDFKANHLVLDNGSLSGVEFPHYNTMECTMCGNCKRFHVERLQDAGFYTIYIGNGYSDRCPAGCADMVLAKGELLDYCRTKGIDCIAFENFRDVERELTSRLILSDD